MIYCFIGCDMGGWHTKNGDALAVCWWNGKQWGQWCISGHHFYPVHKSVKDLFDKLSGLDAKTVIAIDAALAWPLSFSKLVASADTASHIPSFEPTADMNNPYLYRETERFIRDRHNLHPLSAAGDKFGNNSSKGQSLAAWFNTTLVELYRPPFSKASIADANNHRSSLIEVYPAASMRSHAFRNLKWPDDNQKMSEIGISDLNDAKRCALTAVCYAKTVGLLDADFPNLEVYPDVYLPSDADKAYNQELFAKEGWIFAPRIEVAEI